MHYQWWLCTIAKMVKKKIIIKNYIIFFCWWWWWWWWWWLCIIIDILFYCVELWCQIAKFLTPPMLMLLMNFIYDMAALNNISKSPSYCLLLLFSLGIMYKVFFVYLFAQTRNMSTLPFGFLFLNTTFESVPCVGYILIIKKRLRAM